MPKFTADQFDWDSFVEEFRKRAVHACLSSGHMLAAGLTRRVLDNLTFREIEHETLGPNTYLVLRMQCADTGIKLLAENLRGGLVDFLDERHPLGKREIWMPEFVTEGE